MTGWPIRSRRSVALTPVRILMWIILGIILGVVLCCGGLFLAGTVPSSLYR
jgi:hypothetical protein